MNISKLQDLLIKYKNGSDIIQKIIDILRPEIIKKAKYIYYKKYFPISYYIKNNRGYFNLYKNRLCDYQDVENDLWVTVFNILQKFDYKRNFLTYLYSTLWKWRPSFLTKNFIENIKCKKLYIMDDDGKKRDLPLGLKKNDIILKMNINDIINSCDEKQKEILYNILKYKKISQKSLAKKLNTTQQNISLILKKLKKRIKYMV